MSLNARVYVDESFSKDGTYYLAAVIVPIDVEFELESAWNALRREIRDAVVDYFGASKYKHDSKWLPEIHAASLYQSEDEYQKYDRFSEVPIPIVDKNYWLKHVDWLEDALKIQARFELPLIVISGPSEMTLERRGVSMHLADVLEQAWNPEISQPVQFQQMLSKMRVLESRAFTWAFPELLLLIEHELAHRGWRADIVCDDEDDNRGFRLSTLLEEFYNSGALPHIQRVLFEDSKKWAGLQIVDVHAYVLRRALALDAGTIKSPKPTDGRLQSWASSMCQSHIALCKSDTSLIKDRYQKTMPVIMEYLVMNAGGPHEVSRKIWEMMREALKPLSKYL